VWEYRLVPAVGYPSACERPCHRAKGRVGRRSRPHNGGLLRESKDNRQPPGSRSAAGGWGPILRAAAHRPQRTRTRVGPLAPARSVSGGAGGTSCPTTLSQSVTNATHYTHYYYRGDSTVPRLGLSVRACNLGGEDSRIHTVSTPFQSTAAN